MRYLILGKNGMLGQALCNAFEREDFIAFGSSDLDISDREKVFEKLMTVQPDVVINAAGYTDVDGAESNQELANTINGYSVGVLAEACREIDATLVHISTSFVFNGNNKNGYSEEDITDPFNFYGQSKALGEHLLTDEMDLINERLIGEGKYFIIRTSWLFGPHGNSFVDKILTQAKRMNEFKVVDDQWGNPTYTIDLARQILWLLKTNDYPYGIYHITNSGICSKYEWATEVLKKAGLRARIIPCPTSDYPSAARRPRFSILKNNKLPALRNWQDGLEEYIATVNDNLTD